jgi:hypothetical protein
MKFTGKCAGLDSSPQHVVFAVVHSVLQADVRCWAKENGVNGYQEPKGWGLLSAPEPAKNTTICTL